MFTQYSLKSTPLHTSPYDKIIGDAPIIMLFVSNQSLTTVKYVLIIISFNQPKWPPRRTPAPPLAPPSRVRTLFKLSKGYHYTNRDLLVTITNANGQVMSIPAGFGSRRDRQAAIQAGFRPRGGARGGGRGGGGAPGPRAKKNKKRVSILNLECYVSHSTEHLAAIRVIVFHIS